jgi:hypothetical protein
VNAGKLQVKAFFEGTPPHLEQVIPVFHDWIKHHKLPELLIDVANYAHVPKGPGVALIGHESDYFVDETDGRSGLLHSRKRDFPAPADRLGDAFRRLLTAGRLFETSFEGKAKLRTDEFLLRINDRLAAPSNEATFAGVRPELDAFCAKLFAGAGHKLALVGGPKQLFSVKITTDAKADLATLLGRIGGAA